MKNLRKNIAKTFAIFGLGAILLLSACTGGAINSVTTLEAFDTFTAPSVVVFGGTYCPHCVSAMPEIEAGPWATYGAQANFWIQVVDGESGARFDTILPQGYNANFSYEGFTGQECGYVPAWAVIEAGGAVAAASCGSELTIEDMEMAIGELL